MRCVFQRFSCFLFFALVCGAIAQGQVNPHTNIRWPTNCFTSTAMVYNPATNLCINGQGTANNPAGADTQVQFNLGGTFGADSGFTFNRITRIFAAPIFSGALLPTGAGIADWHDTTAGCKVYRGVVNIADCGATDPTGAADSTAAISAAHLAQCANGSGQIFYPPGIYSINPHLANFQTCSNLVEYGPGATLRVSASTGDWAYGFGPNSGGALPTLTNIIFDGLTLDANAVNNTTSLPKIAPCTTGTGAGNAPFTCYQTWFWFQGNYNGKVTNLTIQNCTIYTGGVTVLSATDGTGGGVPSVVTSGIVFKNNHVIFEKQSSTPFFDNSGIYVDAKGVTIDGNTFTSLNQAISDKANTGIEFHGGPGTVTNNKIDWYTLGGYLANTNGAISSGNVISHALNGISVFQLFPMDRNTIIGNVINIDNVDRYPTAGTFNTNGIFLGNSSVLTGAVTNLKIIGNTIVFQPDTSTTDNPNPFNSGGISLFSYGLVQGVDVENNTVENSPVTCINVGTGGSTTGVTDTVTITSNHLNDCGTLTMTHAFSAAVWVDGNNAGPALKNIQIHHNPINFTTNPFAGLYAVAGNPLTVDTSSFVSDNPVRAVNGNPTVNLASSMSQVYPSKLINALTGYQQNGIAPSGWFIRGDGGKGVYSPILNADLPLSTTTGNFSNYLKDSAEQSIPATTYWTQYNAPSACTGAAGWVSQTPNSAADPLGGSTAATFVAPAAFGGTCTGLGQHQTASAPALVNGHTYTFSGWFATASGTATVEMLLADTFSPGCVFTPFTATTTLQKFSVSCTYTSASGSGAYWFTPTASASVIAYGLSISEFAIYATTTSAEISPSTGLVLSGVPFLNATTGNVNAPVNYTIGGAGAAVGHFMRGNGAGFVDGTIQTGDLPAGFVSIRAGAWTITAATSQAVSFATSMSATPSSCSVTPAASAATTGTPFASSLSTAGFTVNVPTSGTLSGTYQCVLNNTN